MPIYLNEKRYDSCRINSDSKKIISGIDAIMENALLTTDGQFLVTSNDLYIFVKKE